MSLVVVANQSTENHFMKEPSGVSGSSRDSTTCSQVVPLDKHVDLQLEKGPKIFSWK